MSVQSVAFGSKIVPAIVTMVNILRSANLRPGEKLLCPTAVLQKLKNIENLSSSSVFFYWRIFAKFRPTHRIFHGKNITQIRQIFKDFFFLSPDFL